LGREFSFIQMGQDDRDLERTIKRQVHHLDRMVGDLLDVTLIEAGRLELRFEEADARKVAQASFDLFASTSPGHQLKLNVPDEAVIFRCDLLRVEQVLNDLF
jgi:K+-sensing histidine kinase KdpD